MGERVHAGRFAHSIVSALNPQLGRVVLPVPHSPRLHTTVSARVRRVIRGHVRTHSSMVGLSQRLVRS